jgi:hypothetical protein
MYGSGTSHEPLDGCETVVQELLVLRYLEELTYDEIASILHVSRRTVKRHLPRAETKLCHAYERCHTHAVPPRRTTLDTPAYLDDDATRVALKGSPEAVVWVGDMAPDIKQSWVIKQQMNSRASPGGRRHGGGPDVVTMECA